MRRTNKIRKRRGLPRPPRIGFDDAVDQIMLAHDERDDDPDRQVLIDNQVLGVAAFLIRWMLDENTGNAPSLYDRAKRDYGTWQRSYAHDANLTCDRCGTYTNILIPASWATETINGNGQRVKEQHDGRVCVKTCITGGLDGFRLRELTDH